MLATLGLSVQQVSAGDLLRGGYRAPASGGGGAQTFTPPTLQQQRQNAQDVLARTTKAVQAAQSLQAAARKIAIAAGLSNLGKNPNNPTQALPNVPNGLNAGGLVPDSGLKSPGVSNPVTTWTGVAGAPTQATSGAKTTVTVVQTLQNAVLNWSSFNIGKQTTLAFNQSKGGSGVNNWIAFNLVNDPTGVPSQILGSIVAPGQVYVINRNGIIFGGASQVNVHALVASSLQINPDLYLNRGLLNNPNSEFLFSALASPPGAGGTPNGDIFVQAGASLNAASSADHIGGKIALVGPNVTNDGTISTPDGQTILAAGLQVGFAAHSSANPTLRGLDVYVGEVSDPDYPAAATAGVATNSGVISSPRGDTTITGRTVDQFGAIESTTSVSLNGRIDLLADYGAIPNPPTASTGGAVLAPFLFTSTGSVVLGEGSVTDILPELDSAETVVGVQLALPSTINVDGQVIHAASGSTVLAPDATINLRAGLWSPVVQGKNQFLFSSTSTTAPQIYLDSGSIINAAGSSDISGFSYPEHHPRAAPRDRAGR